VLIGDDKQLGPVLDYDIKGPTSMFERLILAGYPSHLLNVQYRMHPCILNLPNSLFYENKISSGYVHKDVNFFIDKEKPLLFVNVKGKEQK
jgi:superfamily I DNA and/or RNA helicase